MASMRELAKKTFRATLLVAVFSFQHLPVSAHAEASLLGKIGGAILGGGAGFGICRVLGTNVAGWGEDRSNLLGAGCAIVGGWLGTEIADRLSRDDSRAMTDTLPRCYEAPEGRLIPWHGDTYHGYYKVVRVGQYQYREQSQECREIQTVVRDRNRRVIHNQTHIVCHIQENRQENWVTVERTELIPLGPPPGAYQIDSTGFAVGSALNPAPGVTGSDLQQEQDGYQDLETGAAGGPMQQSPAMQTRPVPRPPIQAVASAPFVREEILGPPKLTWMSWETFNSAYIARLSNPNATDRQRLNLIKNLNLELSRTITTLTPEQLRRVLGTIRSEEMRLSALGELAGATRYNREDIGLIASAFGEMRDDARMILIGSASAGY